MCWANQQTDRQTDRLPVLILNMGGRGAGVNGGGWVMDMGRHTTHKDVGEGRIANYCLAGGLIYTIFQTLSASRYSGY